VAARLYPRRDGLGYVRALVLAHPEYQQAVCFSGEFPFAVEPGQRVRIRGRPGGYRGKSQIKFEARDIALIAQAADNPDLVSIEATVGRVSIQTPEQAWKAFRISRAGYESASGEIPFGIHDGQRLRLEGFKGVYNDKPQLLVCRAEPLGVEYADDRRRIFSEFKIPGDYCDRLDAALGSDFAARVIADPELIGSTLRRTRTATRARIKEACARIEVQDAFSVALRRCSVPEPTVAALIAKYPDGLARLTAYDLIDYSFLDEDRARGPRRGLTGNEADKLAQSEYALRFRPFDPQSLERARCHIEHLARERIESRRRAGLIAAALRAPPPFTPRARRPRDLRRGRSLNYDIPEGPRDVRAALQDKIMHERYVENGTWQHVQDWLRAHGQDELADLFRHSGPSTPGAGIIL
jgi:hypothetical protein